MVYCISSMNEVCIQISAADCFPFVLAQMQELANGVRLAAGQSPLHKTACGSLRVRLFSTGQVRYNAMGDRLGTQTHVAQEKTHFSGSRQADRKTVTCRGLLSAAEDRDAFHAMAAVPMLCLRAHGRRLSRQQHLRATARL